MSVSAKGSNRQNKRISFDDIEKYFIQGTLFSGRVPKKTGAIAGYSEQKNRQETIQVLMYERTELDKFINFGKVFDTDVQRKSTIKNL